MLHKPLAPNAPAIDKEITEGHNVSFYEKLFTGNDQQRISK